MDAMPPEQGTDAPFGGGSVDMNMDMGMEQNMSMQQPQQNFDADFDAGVEANEEEDPKKFIQQLTGKLSQSLRKYNGSLPKPDAELSKYVAGMILKQAVEGLSKDDVADIIEKTDADGEEQDAQDEIGAEQQPMTQGGNQMPEQPEVPMNETTGSPVNTTEKQSGVAPKQMRKGGYSRKPYRATI